MCQRSGLYFAHLPQLKRCSMPSSARTLGIRGQQRGHTASRKGCPSAIAAPFSFSASTTASGDRRHPRTVSPPIGLDPEMPETLPAYPRRISAASSGTLSVLSPRYPSDRSLLPCHPLPGGNSQPTLTTVSPMSALNENPTVQGFTFAQAALIPLSIRATETSYSGWSMRSRNPGILTRLWSLGWTLPQGVRTARNLS